jgi:CheY-like chemotaxis protein
MRALWLDDLADADHYRRLKNAIERADLEVISVTTEESLWKEANNSAIDLYILDFQLPGNSGIDVAQRLLAIVGDVPILFLSEFTQQWSVREQVDPRARFRVLFKPLDEFDRWSDEELAPVLEELLQGTASWVPLKALAPAETPSIWTQQVSELPHSSLETMLELEAQAVEDLRLLTNAVFRECDAEWIVLVGKEPRLVAWGELDSEPPSPDALRKLERIHGEFPLVIFRDVEIAIIDNENGHWPHCSFAQDERQRAVDRFPTLELELNGVNLSTHVDTGSIHSWLSYEDAVSASVLSRESDHRAWYPGRVSLVGGKGSVIHWMNAELRAAARSADGYTSIVYAPRVVRNWRLSALARLCSVGACPRSELDSGRGHWCGSRRGLVGRDLLRRNKILLVFDSIRSLTYVLNEAGGQPSAPSAPATGSWEWTPSD